MTSLEFFNGFLIAMIVLAAVVFSVLFFIDAGYGQYIDTRWGTAISNKAGWVIMEVPVVIVFFLYWVTSDRRFESAPLVFFLLFNLHYLQRTFVFPWLIRGHDLMPLSIILFGMVFNGANAYMQGMWIFHLAPADLYTPAWLTTPQFLGGLAIFLSGFTINLHADHIIRTLRPPGDTGFHIPRGGLFEYVSAANYFGELTEWVGWGVMTWSLPGLVFAIWTFANLGPRAHRHHHWYLETFGDAYPKHRKRMIPFLY
jgi:3-oxo-5-alpha-steroid 4-dehydrogenase 1